MTSAAARQDTPRSVDREAAELRRRWWDDRETTPELVLEIARFEARTGRVIVAPGEATRPGLLEVVDALVKQHPAELPLHRMVREAAWAMPVKDRTVCWRDAEGAWHVDWPGQGLRLVSESLEAPWEPGVRRWEMARKPFYERPHVWRVIRRLVGGVDAAYLEELHEWNLRLDPDHERGTWGASYSYVQDTPYSMHAYSLAVNFRPSDGQVELFESVDTE